MIEDDEFVARPHMLLSNRHLYQLYRDARALNLDKTIVACEIELIMREHDGLSLIIHRWISSKLLQVKRCVVRRIH